MICLKRREKVKGIFCISKVFVSALSLSALTEIHVELAVLLPHL